MRQSLFDSASRGRSLFLQILLILYVQRGINSVRNWQTSVMDHTLTLSTDVL